VLELAWGIDAFAGFAEDVMSWVGSFVLHTDAASLCQLETAVPIDPRDDDLGVLINKGGGLMTVLRIEGSLKPIADEMIEKMVLDLTTPLINSFKTGRHLLDIVFERNDPRTMHEIERAYAPYITQIRRLKMHPMMERMMRDEMAAIRKHVSSEAHYWVLYTRLHDVSKAEIKLDANRRKELNGEHPLGRIDYGQSPLLTLQSAIRDHRTYVERMVEDLKAYFAVTPLTSREVGHLAKAAYDEAGTADDWRPALPGDPIRLRRVNAADDNSGCVWPKLAIQVTGGRSPHAVKNTPYVKVGPVYFGTILLREPPLDDSILFRKFFESVRREIPWRMNMRLTPDGLSELRVRTFILTFAAWLGDNAGIKRSLDALEDYAKDGCVVGMRVAFQTWSRSLDELEQRVSDLNKAVEGWGICGTMMDSGEPFRQFYTGLPAFTSTHMAPMAPAPIEQVMELLPLQRPAAPWSSGVLFRSRDGRPYPFSPVSAIMTFLVGLYIAPPGSGKSVFMGRMFWVTALAPTGLDELSPVGSIDIGPTQVKQAELLRELLPAEMRHQVVAHRMRDSIDLRINPCDTLPGCRTPIGMHRQFLEYLLGLICSPLKERGAEPYPMIDKLASMVIDVAYKQSSEAVSAKLYEDADPQVAGALSEIGYEADRHTTWWEVTDNLWKAGRRRESMLAQRFAVPTMRDFITAATDASVRAVFAKEGHVAEVREIGMTLIDTFIQCVESAIKDYPVLQGTTTFELGDARVIALDLDEVAKGSGPSGERRIALWMMLCRNLFAQRWYRKVRDNAIAEVLDRCPEDYHNWHIHYATRMQELRKTLFVDELHRSGGAIAFRNQLEQDGREGRKWGIDMHFASQFADDFPEKLRQIATAVYILDGRVPEVVQCARELYEFSPEAVRLLVRFCVGPTSRGAGFLARFVTSKGVVDQLLYNTMGARMLWNVSTTPEDTNVRDRVTDLIGKIEGLEALAEVMGTSAKDEVQRRRNRSSEDAETNVYEDIAREIQGKWEKLKAAQKRQERDAALV
jgi:intracellular multiplication protein IcmB